MKTFLCTLNVYRRDKEVKVKFSAHKYLTFRIELCEKRNEDNRDDLKTPTVVLFAELSELFTLYKLP